MLALQGGAADEITLLGGEAHGELGQGHGEDGNLAAVGGNAHLVAVQGEGRLHAQGIPCAQAGRPRAQLHQPVPQPHGVLAADVYLVAQRLAGVAGLGDAGLVTLQGHGAQGVLGGLLGGGHAAGQGHEHFLALGTLHGDGGPLVADVGDGAVEARQRPVQVLQVLVDVGGVDHQQIVVLLEQIQIRVVHGAAVLVGNDAVLGHVQVQGADVAGQHVLKKFLALGPLNQQAAHVGHVEQAAHLAGIQVLGDDAGGILDGHLPPAEVHHGGPGGHMHVIQLRALQFAHFLSSSFRFVPFLGNRKRAQSCCFAPPYPDLRDSPPHPGQVAPSVAGRIRPFRSIVRTRSLLPESFCVPLRRRARRAQSLPSPSTDFPIPLSHPFYHGAGKGVNRNCSPQETFG